MPKKYKDKVIILDVDGTVVDSPTNEHVTEAVIHAIKRASEKYTICLATGRTWQWTKSVYQSLELQSPTIVSGGTEIRDADGTILWQEHIPDQRILEIADVFSDYKDSLYLVDNYSLEEYFAGGTISYEELFSKRGVREFQLPYLAREIADELEAKITRIQGVTAVKTTSFREGRFDLHVMSSFATKEHAITELLKITQIDVDKTTGVGDGHNDLHIFAAVKNKIAMGNAVSELKEAADSVIGRVDEDGLAEYLNELVNEAA